MRTDIPEKLLKVVEEIDERGNVNLTRLTVLKKWFARPERLSAFAIWIATKAVSRKGKTRGAAAELFRKARTLTGLDMLHPKPDRQAAEVLHDRLRDFQNEYENQRWGPVRIVHNWNLMLVEHGLAIYLWHLDSPAHGFSLLPFYTTRLFWSQNRSNRANAEVAETPVSTGAIKGCQTEQKTIFDLEGRCSIQLSYGHAGTARWFVQCKLQAKPGQAQAEISSGARFTPVCGVGLQRKRWRLPPRLGGSGVPAPGRLTSRRARVLRGVRPRPAREAWRWWANRLSCLSSETL